MKTTVLPFLLMVASALSAAAAESTDDVRPASNVGGDRQLAVAWNELNSDRGIVQAMATSQPWQFLTPALPVGADPVLRFALGRLFVVSGRTGTISIIDPDSWTVQREYELGESSTPLDIAVVSPRRAYVTRQGATHLLRLNLITGATAEVVDLGALAGVANTPDPGMMAKWPTRLFVQVRRLNMPPALLAVVDLATEQLIDVDPNTPEIEAIVLQGRAPKFKMQRLQRRLFVSATGGFFDQGGIEMVDITRLRSLGLIIREADGQVGADLGAFTLVDADRGYLTYSTDLLTSSHLHAFTVDGNVEITEFQTTLSYFVPRLVFDSATHSLYYPEGGWAPAGVHVFDARTGERLTREPTLTTGPIVDLEFINRE